MASNLIAQSNPSATTLTDICTMPFGPQRVAEVYITNQDTVGVTVRLAIAPGGATAAAKHYLVYDQVVGPGRSLVVSFRPRGLQLDAGDVVRGYASTGNVSFNVIGTD